MGLYNYSQEIGQPYSYGYWQNLYNKSGLGSKYGGYRGSSQQNTELENLVRQGGGPGSFLQPTSKSTKKPAKKAGPGTTLGNEAGKNAPQAASWQEFYNQDKMLDQFDPLFRDVASQYVTPEVSREYDLANRQYMGNMAQTGGGAFGWGWGGAGALEAEASRRRTSQMEEYRQFLRNQVTARGDVVKPEYEKWRNSGQLEGFQGGDMSYEGLAKKMDLQPVQQTQMNPFVSGNNPYSDYLSSN